MNDFYPLDYNHTDISDYVAPHLAYLIPSNEPSATPPVKPIINTIYTKNLTGNTFLKNNNYKDTSWKHWIIVQIYPHLKSAGVLVYNKERTIKNQLDSNALVIPKAVLFNGKVFPIKFINNGAFYKYRGTKLSLPDSIEFIGARAFYKSNISNLVLPPNIRYIGSRCFEASSISKVLFENPSKHISRRKFYQQEYNTFVTLIGRYYNVINYSIIKHSLLLGAGVFFNCRSLKTVVLPKSLYYLPDDMFNGCSRLSNIISQNNAIKYIFENAFFNCPKKLTNSLPTLFKNCTISYIHNSCHHFFK